MSNQQQPGKPLRRGIEESDTEGNQTRYKGVEEADTEGNMPRIKVPQSEGSNVAGSKHVEDADTEGHALRGPGGTEPAREDDTEGNRFHGV